MIEIKFSEASLQKIPLQRAKKPNIYKDFRYPNLYLYSRKTVKSFLFRFQSLGKTKYITLGRYPNNSLSEIIRIYKIYLNQEIAVMGPAQEKNTSKKTLTISNFFWDYYFPHVKIRKKSWRHDRAHFEHHLSIIFADLELHQVSAIHVQRFVDMQLEKGCSPSSINMRLVMLGRILDFANQMNVPNAARRADLNISLLRNFNQKQRFLTAEEAKSLLSALSSSRNKTIVFIVSFLLFTGARVGEALSAEWRHFDLKQRLWHVPMTKSGRPRTIVLSKRSISILEKVKNWQGQNDKLVDSPYVFVNPKTLLAYTTIQKPFYRARRIAGLDDVRIHDLRHSFASSLVNSGVSIYEVQSLLGHSSVTTTMRYAHLSQEKLKASVDGASYFYF